MKPTFTHACLLRLLRLYPRVWRERYAAEVAAVLEESPATFAAIFDMFLSILDAYLHSDLFTERKFVMVQRLRSSQIMIYCSAVFFNIVMLLYTSESVYFWYPGLANQREYSLALALIDYSGIFLLVITLIGSLIFIAALLKQVLTDEHRSGFYVWSLLIAAPIVALPFIFYQIVVPADSTDALARVIIQLPYISSMLAIFGNEICVALVFVGLQQVLDKKKAGGFKSSIFGYLALLSQLCCLSYETALPQRTYPPITFRAALS